MIRKKTSVQQVSRRYFGLERNIFFTGLTSFFTDTSTKMVYSVMPLFLLSMGASKTTLSLIEGIAESTASLLKGVSGFWSDRIGKNKPFLIIGYGLTALVTPVYAFLSTPLQVLWLRFSERVGKGIRTAPRDSLISASIRAREAGKSFGFHKAMDNSGAIIGPLLASVFLLLFPGNYRLIFILAGIPAVIGIFILIIFIKEKRIRIAGDRKKNGMRELPRRFYFFLIIIFIFSLGNSTDALLIVRTTETGINTSFIPFIYMLFNTVSVILAIPAGKLSDRIGREKLILSGFLIYSLVYFMFGAFNSLAVFIGAFILYGFYSALADSSQKALISDFTGLEIKGTAFGLYHALIGITLLPASLIAGYLYDHVSSSAPFYFGALLSFTAALLMAGFIYMAPASGSATRKKVEPYIADK